MDTSIGFDPQIKLHIYFRNVLLEWDGWKAERDCDVFWCNNCEYHELQ